MTLGLPPKNSKFGYPKVMVMSLNFFQIAFRSRTEA